MNQFVEKIQSVFNLGEKSSELSTAEKYYKLANRQLLEAEKEVNEKEIQKAIKNIKEFKVKMRTKHTYLYRWGQK